MDNKDYSRGAVDGKRALLIGVLLFVMVGSAYVGSWFSRDRELRDVDGSYRVDMIDEDMLSEMPVPVLIRTSFEVQRLADERWREKRKEVMMKYPWLPTAE